MKGFATRGIDRPERALTALYAAISVYAVGSLALVATHRVGLTSEHVILLGLVALGLVPGSGGSSATGSPSSSSR